MGIDGAQKAAISSRTLAATTNGALGGKSTATTSSATSASSVRLPKLALIAVVKFVDPSSPTRAVSVRNSPAVISLASLCPRRAHVDAHPLFQGLKCASAQLFSRLGVAQTSF